MYRVRLHCLCGKVSEKGPTANTANKPAEICVQSGTAELNLPTELNTNEGTGGWYAGHCPTTRNKNNKQQLLLSGPNN